MIRNESSQKLYNWKIRTLNSIVILVLKICLNMVGKFILHTSLLTIQVEIKKGHQKEAQILLGEVE